jgi:hypothetical protein
MLYCPCQSIKLQLWMCIGEADAPASAVIGLNVINVIDANQSDGQWKILSP